LHGSGRDAVVLTGDIPYGRKRRQGVPTGVSAGFITWPSFTWSKTASRSTTGASSVGPDLGPTALHRELALRASGLPVQVKGVLRLTKRRLGLASTAGASGVV
jgi:hypothetical protein